jgi:hypothetical protein
VKHRYPSYGAPPRFQSLMRCLDPADGNCADVRIGADLLANAYITKEDLRAIDIWLTGFLADPVIVNADIAGLLNRSMGRYNPFDIGGRALLSAVHRQVRTLV